jgi:hypothetical protein
MFVYLVHSTIEDLEFHDEVLEIHASLTTAKKSVEKSLERKKVTWTKRQPHSMRSDEVPTWTPSPSNKAGSDYEFYISKERVL